MQFARIPSRVPFDGQGFHQQFDAGFRRAYVVPDERDGHIGVIR